MILSCNLLSNYTGFYIEQTLKSLFSNNVNFWTKSSLEIEQAPATAIRIK